MYMCIQFMRCAWHKIALFFVRGFNTIRVSRFLHFKVRYWVRSIYGVFRVIDVCMRLHNFLVDWREEHEVSSAGG